jgi:hypothetical protein
MEIMAVYSEVQKKDIKKLRGQNGFTNFKADVTLSNHWASKVEIIQEEINLKKKISERSQSAPSVPLDSISLRYNQRVALAQNSVLFMIKEKRINGTHIGPHVWGLGGSYHIYTTYNLLTSVDTRS